jgi:hypothetical protein
MDFRTVLLPVLLGLLLAGSILGAIGAIRLSSPPAATAASHDTIPPPSATTPWDTGVPAVPAPSTGGFLPKAVLLGPLPTETTNVVEQDVRPKPAGRSPKPRAAVRRPRGESTRETARDTERALAALGQSQLDARF